MFVNEQSLRDWNLTIYYYSLNSAEFCITIEEIEARTADLEEFLQVNGIPCSEASLADKHTSTLGESVREDHQTYQRLAYNQLSISNYFASFTTTNSYNTQAESPISQIIDFFSLGC